MKLNPTGQSNPSAEAALSKADLVDAQSVLVRRTAKYFKIVAVGIFLLPFMLLGLLMGVDWLFVVGTCVALAGALEAYRRSVKREVEEIRRVIEELRAAGGAPDRP